MTDQQFIPTIWGHHGSDHRVAFGHIASIPPENDFGSEPVSVFASRIYKDDLSFNEINNRPLFSWRGVYDDKMIMLANGNLGLGTTNPQARLEIKSSSDYYDGRDLLIVHNNSNDSLSLASIKLKSGDDNSFTALQHNAGSYTWEGRSDLGILWNDGNGLVLAATSDTGNVRFETGGAPGLAKERFRITKDGNVGIGTSIPQRILHINDVMRLEPCYLPPENPSEGDIYMDGNDHVLKVYNGTEWKSCW